MVLVNISSVLKDIVNEEVHIYVTHCYIDINDKHIYIIKRRIRYYQLLHHSKSCAEVSTLDDFGLLDYDVDIVRKYIGRCMQCYLLETNIVDY